jgi:tetratricopeptide (TPR) repeat protein
VTGDLPKAVEQYQLLVHEYPRYYWGHHNLGNREAERGMIDQAAAEFRQLLQVEPDNYHSWTELGWAYAVLGRVDEAQAVLNEGVSRKIDAPPLHSTLYFIAFLKGDDAAMRQQVAWAIGKTEAESDALGTESHTQGYYGG